MTVSKLCEEEAAIYVQPPEGVEPYNERRMQAMEGRMQAMESLESRFTVLEKGFDRLNALALGRLLDDTRTKLAGHVLREGERGQAWNEKLLTINTPSGMSKAAVNLTQYAPGSEQDLRNRTAHSFEEAAIAAAVTSVQSPTKGALYREMYRLCYDGRSADDVVVKPTYEQ